MEDVADLFGDGDEEPEGTGGEPLPPTPPAEEVDPCAPRFVGYRKDRNDKSYPVDQYGTRWFGDRSKQQRSRPPLADPDRWYGPGSAAYRRTWKDSADTAAAVVRESVVEFDDFDGMKTSLKHIPTRSRTTSRAFLCLSMRLLLLSSSTWTNIVRVAISNMITTTLNVRRRCRGLMQVRIHTDANALWLALDCRRQLRDRWERRSSRAPKRLSLSVLKSGRG